MMSEAKLREFEMAQLGNLAPSTAEEAKTLIPRYHHHPSSEHLASQSIVCRDTLTTRRCKGSSTT